MKIQDIISSGLLELYVLDIATHVEKNQVENWARQYPEVADELLRIHTVMEEYALIHAVEPGLLLKGSILAKLKSGDKRIEANGYETAKVVKIPYLRWAAAASIALLIISSIYNVVLFNKYQHAETSRKEAESQLLAKAEENRAMESDMNVVQSRYSEPVALHGQVAAPDAAAKIFWMKNTGEVYVDPINLPEPPTGKQYQLWAIVDGQPVDAGMISPLKGKKVRIQKMKSFGRAEAFAITLEDEGGHPAPKGEMYVMGKI